MLAKIEKFMRLSMEEKKLFIEAVFTLGMMRLALLIFSFKRLTRSLEQTFQVKKIPLLDKDQLHIAQIVGKSITKAAAHTPWESACLVQALTAQRMLKKRGIPGVFYLGAKKDKASTEGMAAHAWVQCGDNIITGGSSAKEFTILSIFGWDSK